MHSTRRGPPLSLRASGGGARLVGTLVGMCLVALAFIASEAVAAQPPVGLGTADSFAVLAGTTVTNTGPSTINGGLGLTPGTAVTGFPPGTVNGTIHVADAVAGQAQTDLTTAYNDAAGRIPALAVPADLGGLALTPGVYRSASSLGLTGTLILDAQGDPGAVFVFQAGSTLTTASGSRVSLINGAQPCNVFWQIGSSATLGTSSVFAGNILALTSISMNDGVTVTGRALARNGAVTLINDTITVARCATGGGTPGTPSTPPSTSVTPSTPGTPSTPPSAPGTPSTPPSTPGAPGTPPSASGAPGIAGAENGTALLRIVPRSVSRTVARFGTRRCVPGRFRAVVSGLFVRRVVFSLGGRVIATRSRAPFRALVRARRGNRTLVARVTFGDGTPAATLRLRFRACAMTTRPPPRSPSLPPRGPGGFTG